MTNGSNHERALSGVVFPVLRCGFVPVAANRVRCIFEVLFVGVAVLDDDGGDALRMSERQAEAGAGAIVEELCGLAI